MKKPIVFTFTAILLIMCILLCGCNDTVKSPNLMDDVSAGEVSKIPLSAPGNTAVTDFALRLFKAGNEDGKNTLISPLSVLAALSMTANGAKGNTLTEMENVLGMPVSELNSYMHSYMSSLPQGEKYKLSLANSIWFTDDARFTVNDTFLQTNADYFGADIYKSPFDDTTLKDINNWVKQNTDGMIPEILDEIPPEAVMYLVNALAFEAEWTEIYTEDTIRTNDFTTENGSIQQVEFMYSTENKYLESENATGFIKYYKDNKYAFAALLPNEGMSVSQYIDSLNGELLAEMLANAQNISVDTAIPKFETEYDTEMSVILSALGMPTAFDPSAADFSALGVSSAGNIFINRVLHKTFISVGERGTKAGAATVVEMLDEAATEIIDSKKVYLDRPFVYMLIDCENNIPFFIGTLMNIDGAPEPEKIEHEFDVQYVGTGAQEFGFEYPIVEVIRSVDDINAHYEKYQKIYYLKGFLEACEKYDNEYFNDNILIIVIWEEGSSTPNHKITDVYTEDSILNINLERIEYGCGNCAMAEYHFIIETSKAADTDKNNIQVNISTRYEEFGVN